MNSTHFLDYDIVESIHCMVLEKQVVRRSWCERLLSRPWRPWTAERAIVAQVPDPNIYLMDQMGK